MGMLKRTPSASSQKLPPAIAASATTLSRLIVASASMMTAAAETKSPAVPALADRPAVVVASLGPHIERDDDEHPCADELDQRHVEQGVGEQDHDEPEHDRADRAEKDRAARVVGRQPPAGEGDDDRVVRAKQQVDEEDLQEEEEPAGGVDHVRRSKGSNPPASGSPSSIRQPQGFGLSGEGA